MTDSQRDNTSAGRAIDMRVIDDLRELGGSEDPGLLAELIDLFLSDAPGRLRDVEEGLAKGEIARVERAAHTLKSSSANIGAMNLSAICKRIEELARKKESAGIAPLLAEGTRSYSEAETALRALKT